MWCDAPSALFQYFPLASSPTVLASLDCFLNFDQVILKIDPCNQVLEKCERCKEKERKSKWVEGGEKEGNKRRSRHVKRYLTHYSLSQVRRWLTEWDQFAPKNCPPKRRCNNILRYLIHFSILNYPKSKIQFLLSCKFNNWIFFLFPNYLYKYSNFQEGKDRYLLFALALLYKLNKIHLRGGRTSLNHH